MTSIGAEVVRVEDFLDSRGESLKRQMAAERDDASAKMEFETAAAIHARLDKLAPVLQQLPEFVRRIDQSHAVIVQKSRQPESVALFRVDGGALAGPLEFPISGSEHTKSQSLSRSLSQSMEARIQAALAAFPAAKPGSAIERMEHLAILKRWCYRGSRAGRNFLCRCQGRAADAAPGAGDRTRVQRRSAGGQRDDIDASDSSGVTTCSPPRRRESLSWGFSASRR